MKGLSKTLVLLLVFCFSTACDFTLNNLKFDSGKWKTADLRTKGRMFRDLRDSRILEGKTKVEIDNLLGKPTFENPNTWVYKIDLGHKFGSTAWTYNLNVEFDQTTKTVQKVYAND